MCGQPPLDIKDQVNMRQITGKMQSMNLACANVTKLVLVDGLSQHIGREVLESKKISNDLL